MLRVTLARGLPLVERLDPHASHERRHVLATHHVAFANQQPLQRAAACKGVLEVQLVDAPLQLKVLLRDRPRRVIHGGPRNAH